MNICLEGVFYIIGGIIRLIDLTSDIWYVSSQEFETDWLYYLSCALILSPSVIILTICWVSALLDLCKLSIRSCLMNFGLGLILAILDPLGLILCCFGCMLSRKKSNQAEFYVAEAITRSSGFIEGIFESLPQLAVQTYNNILTDSWEPRTFGSIAISATGFMYSLLKLLYAIDRIRKEEHENYLKRVSRVSSMLPVHISTRGVGNSDQYESNEVFEFAFNFESN